MTSIKPPTGPTAPLPTGQLEGADAIAAKPGVSGAAQASAVGATTGANVADPIAQLAAAISRGELISAQAFDQLIERAVADMSGHLDAAQRMELASVLRAAFEGDPVLRTALGDPSAG